MRILYGVEGEGHGHATRSKAILDELTKKHEVLVAASDKAYKVLKNHFTTIEVKNFPLHYGKNKRRVWVNPLFTIFLNTLKFPSILLYNLKLFYHAFKFKPEIIITDFETFTCWYAILARKKIIALELLNFHPFIKTTVMHRMSILDKFVSLLLTKFKMPSADYFIVPSFLPKNKIKSNMGDVFICKPPMRKQFHGLRPVAGDHIVVYQTANFVPALEAIKDVPDETFFIYGVPEPIRERYSTYTHLKFRDFSEEYFPKKLASSKAVITNAGYLLITEALYLRKPLLCFPINGHFEQKLNAKLVKESGFGDYSFSFNSQTIRTFLQNLVRYEDNLKNYSSEQNADVFSVIKNLLSRN